MYNPTSVSEKDAGVNFSNYFAVLSAMLSIRKEHFKNGNSTYLSA